MKYGVNKKYFLLFSAVLIGYQYFGLVIDEAIPYTKIKIGENSNINLMLVILIAFFGTQFIYQSTKVIKEEKNRFEFYSTLFVGITAISPEIYGHLVTWGVDWKVILSLGLLFLASLPLVVVVQFIITILFSLRSSSEMKRKGLGRLPAASKAFLASILILIPLSALIILLFYTYSYKFPILLQNIWGFIYILLPILLNLDSLFNILMCLGPKSIRAKAISNLTRFQDAIDLHEMHYQYIGHEIPKSHDQPEICEAAESGDTKELERLLDVGCDPNEQDARGWSVLMWATAEGHLESVELILEHGADPNIINYLGRSAIMYASNYGFEDIAQVLLDYGATPNLSGELNDHPPLSAAASNGNIGMVKLLLKFQADLTFTNREGFTALDLAMSKGHGDVAKLLRKAMLENDKTPTTDKTDLVKNIDWISKKR